MLQLLGYRRIVVKTDQESAINALAHMVTKGRRLEKSLKDKDDQHDQSMVMRKTPYGKPKGRFGPSRLTSKRNWCDDSQQFHHPGLDGGARGNFAHTLCRRGWFLELDSPP